MTTILIDENTPEGRELIRFLRKKKSVQVLDNSNEKDWWNIISEKEKHAIEEGLADINNGNTVAYEAIKDKYARCQAMN